MRLKVEMRPSEIIGQRVTTEDGTLVEGIKSVKWSASAADRPIVVLELFAERVNLDLSDPEPDV